MIISINKRQLIKKLNDSIIIFIINKKSILTFSFFKSLQWISNSSCTKDKRILGAKHLFKVETSYGVID